MQIYSETKVNR